MKQSTMAFLLVKGFITQKENKLYYYLFLIFLLFNLFPSCIQAQECGGEGFELLIETSLGTGQVCENSAAEVSVDVTPESFYALNQIDSIQWIWYVDLPGQSISFDDIIPPGVDIEETTFPPFNPIAQNSHVYDELSNLGCDVLEGLISIPPNKIEMSIATRGFVTCADGGIESHFNTVGFDLTLEPRAGIDISASTICLNETVDLVNTGCFGDNDLSYWTLDGSVIQNNGGDILDFSPPAPGNYEVCLNLINNCGEDVDCQTLTVVPEPDAEFDIPTLLLDGEGCAGGYEFCNISDTINGYNLEYYWGVYLNGSLQGQLDTQQYTNCFFYTFTDPDDYELVLTATNFVCDTIQYSFEFTILPSAFATLNDSGPFCISDFSGYTPSVSYTGNISDYSWTFENGTPATSTDPEPTGIDFPVGTHNVSLVVNSACGETTYTTTVTIDDEPTIAFSNIADAYCIGQGDTIKVIPDPPNGSWNSSLIFNDSCVSIDNLNVGANTFTYTYGSGACNSSEDITINVTDTTAIVFEVTEEVFCEDDGIIQIGTVAPSGGTWSGSGITDADLGLIDAGLIGAGSTTTISYSFTNNDGCLSVAEKTVLIEGLPTSSLPLDTISLCDVPGTVDLNEELGIQLLPGYTDEWIGNCLTENGIITPDCLGIGVFNVAYAVFTPNECTDTTDFTIIINPFEEANAGADLSECVSDGATITLVGTPTGGNWEGTNISADGIITIDNTMDGDYNYTYTYGGVNCENEDEVTVTIINLNDLSASLPDYCETETVVTLPDGTPAGGDWVYDGNILPDNELDISALGAGNFVLEYQVEATTSNNEVCTNAIPVDLFIDALPDPIIEIPEAICINMAEMIINNTTEEYSSWSWDFGNGTTGNGLTPTFEYTATGDYTITLEIQDTVCLDVFTWDVSVSSPPPPLGFDLQLLSADSCELLEVAFVNQSIVDPNVTDVVYIWDFGNGIVDTTFSVSESPENIFFEAFESDTIYTVTLSALNNCGEVNPAMETVYVKPQPISRFSAEYESYCSGATVDFVNASVGNPENTIINLGDGSPLIFDYPFDTLSHQYFIGDEAATFIVEFISVNPCGSDTVSFPLDVFPVDVTSGFTVDDNGVFCENNPVCLTGSATPGATVWYEMGDGNTLFSNDTCYTYAQAGDYTITQYALDFCGGVDTLQIPVSILSTPDISIDADQSICFGDSINLSLSISNDVVGIDWDFGDGNTSNLQNPVHYYQAPGTYTITANASSLESCMLDASVTVTVEELLAVSFAFEDSICANESTILSTTTSGNNYSCLWSIDGGIAYSECNPMVDFDDSGIYNISLVLTDNITGCQNKRDSFVFVRPTPIAGFDANLPDECEPNVYRFFNKSENANIAFWDFGDGTVSTQLDSISHVFEEEGIFEVILLSSFDGICFDTVSQIIEIPELLSSAINLADPNGCEPFTPIIQNQSTGVNLTYQWSASNGVNGFEEDFNPVFFTESASEVIDIQLVAIDVLSGCADTSTVEVTVFDTPELTLLPTHTSCNGGSDGTILTTISGGTPNYQYDWSVPGDMNMQVNLPADIYSLTLTDSNNCSVVASTTITEPSPILIQLDNIQNATCAGLEDGSIEVQASGGTTTTGDEFTYQWSAGQSASNDQSLVVDLGAGFYTVTVTDQNQCTEESTFTIEDGYELEVADTIIGISCEDMVDGQIKIEEINNGVPTFLAILNGTKEDTLNSDGGIFNFKDLPAGNYSLSIVDKNNCIYEDDYTVPSWQDPVLNLYVENDELFRCDSLLMVANATGSNLTYQWFPEVNLTCLNNACDSVKVSPENDITYTITVEDERTCIVEGEVDLTIDEDRTFFVPTAFTPNGDGTNDVFRIRVGKHQEFLLSEISSFNVADRWGNILYRKESFHPFYDPEIGWDGKIEGVKAPSDIYTFWAEFVFCDGQKELIKGHVQLIR